MTMADTIAVMNGGRIEQMGSPTELYEVPRTTFTANFLGQKSFANQFQVEYTPSKYAGVHIGYRFRHRQQSPYRTSFFGVSPLRGPCSTSMQYGGLWRAHVATV